MYKITLSGNNEAIEGLESLTEEEALAWLNENQEHYEEPNEFLDTTKYILMPLD